jgi:2-polyprenyl-6-methoxyphenol hydroxylase-like FAD-dependent oxidoreductase
MPTRVLIVGAGISGSIVAFWLARHPLFRVTVIERSKLSQKMGQGLEIEEPATSVVRAMGILDKFQAIRTSERGFELNDERGRVFGRFEAGPFSPTGALEMMRGDMCEVLYRAADDSPNVTYRYETTINSLHQDTSSVTVDLLNRTTQTTTSETFDLVIGADGALSKTRHLAMGSPEQLKCFNPIGAYCAYFSIPAAAQDSPYSRACNFPGRRILWTRPVRDDSPVTSCYAIHVTSHNPKLHAAFLSKDRAVQKQALADDFKDGGWEAPRIIEELQTAENFYFDELAQVKLDRWSEDRVVLTGDAGWAPTPFTVISPRSPYKQAKDDLLIHIVSRAQATTLRSSAPSSSRRNSLATPRPHPQAPTARPLQPTRRACGRT